jgi:hypothetical protein
MQAEIYEVKPYPSTATHSINPVSEDLRLEAEQCEEARLFECMPDFFLPESYRSGAPIFTPQLKIQLELGVSEANIIKNEGCLWPLEVSEQLLQRCVLLPEVNTSVEVETWDPIIIGSLDDTFDERKIEYDVPHLDSGPCSRADLASMEKILSDFGELDKTEICGPLPGCGDFLTNKEAMARWLCRRR